jgi:hypothetical protein
MAGHTRATTITSKNRRLSPSIGIYQEHCVGISIINQSSITFLDLAS